MMRAGIILLAAFLAGASLPCAAAVLPQPGHTDPRIRIVHYDPNQVIELKGTLGYQISVEFSDDERIENISIGDSLAWQVTPNHKANLLFLKPLRRGAVTNMSVFTNLRRYTFDLSVQPGAPLPGDHGIIFGLRFDYPEPASAVLVGTAEPPKPEPPHVVNDSYSYEGSYKILPARVFDDGQSTYFVFADATDYPAIFILDADNQEAIVNVRTSDGFVVVDQIARGFVLRHGSEVTRIINDGYKEQGPGPMSPKPHKEETSSIFDRLFQ